jgi:3-vinyl bacteriochlorophyllide hydratase
VNDKNKEVRGVGLYTPEQKLRRDETVWTLVQGVLAPLQFLVFAVSAVLVVNFLLNGTGLFAASASVVVKTGILYTIMVTGAIWEKVVFGRYLFASSFFWEDVVSMGVIALHTLYLAMWFSGVGGTTRSNVGGFSGLRRVCRQRHTVFTQVQASQGGRARGSNDADAQ